MSIAKILQFYKEGFDKDLNAVGSNLYFLGLASRYSRDSVNVPKERKAMSKEDHHSKLREAWDGIDLKLEREEMSKEDRQSKLRETWDVNPIHLKLKNELEDQEQKREAGQAYFTSIDIVTRSNSIRYVLLGQLDGDGSLHATLRDCWEKLKICRECSYAKPECMTFQYTEGISISRWKTIPPSQRHWTCGRCSCSYDPYDDWW
jgi:hypothetical protein